METRIVTRKGTVIFDGNEFVPCDPDILLRNVGALGRVLVMADAFPEAIIVHDQDGEFLCNAYMPIFWQEANQANAADASHG